MTDKILWAFALGNLVLGIIYMERIGTALTMAGM